MHPRVALFFALFNTIIIIIIIIFFLIGNFSIQLFTNLKKV